MARAASTRNQEKDCRLTRKEQARPPAIVWFRRDLRLKDNPALTAAAQHDGPVIPVFILDETPQVRFPGAAALWWLDKSLRSLEGDLKALNSNLVLRRGVAASELRALCQQTGAARLFFNRLYDPGVVDRDADLAADLNRRGVDVQTFNASLLLEPRDLRTQTGGIYQVFTPFWRAARQRIAERPIHDAPGSLESPKTWPRTDRLTEWGLHPQAPDWSTGFAGLPGEAAAHETLQRFVKARLHGYQSARDRPAIVGTSRLSAPLHWGEIGPYQAWRAIQTAAHDTPSLHLDEDRFLSELGWREFNHHLLFARPDLPDRNYKPAFDAFPWREDRRSLEAWRRGRTGYPMVDAGLRELWTTGFMHNRVRMIVASFLIKHLLIDWREGERWFWETLIDASPANNVLNWQWVAGSGADASPFFRIFNPVAQGERFDPDGAYVRRWAPELARLPSKLIHAPWTATHDALKTAGVRLGETYPKPIVDHDVARRRALDALKSMRQPLEDKTPRSIA